MGLPFQNTIVKAVVKQAIDAGEKFLAGLKSKLDADNDGIKDFDEYPKLFADIREGAEQVVESVDAPKLTAAVGKIAEGVNELRAALDVEEAKDGLAKVRVAGAEIIKLAGLAFAQLQKKEGK